MLFEVPRRMTPSINLSALIDIAFILVIFVVLAANFDRIRSLSVKLPEARASASRDKQALPVQIPPQGPLRVGDQTVALSEVGAVLRRLRPQYQSVAILADKAAAVQRAVRVLSEARAAGFASVGFATRGADEGGR